MIFDAIQEWFQELLIDGIISNLTGMFDTLNTKVGEIAGEVGMTPSAWNSGIFNMVRNLSETVIVPIAGIVLTFVMCYELIQLIVEKEQPPRLRHLDLLQVDLQDLLRGAHRHQHLEHRHGGVRCGAERGQPERRRHHLGRGHRHIRRDRRPGDPARGLEHRRLLGLWFQSIFVGLCTQILSICIFLVIYGRMIEVYLVTSIGPIRNEEVQEHITPEKDDPSWWWSP